MSQRYEFESRGGNKQLRWEFFRPFSIGSSRHDDETQTNKLYKSEGLHNDTDKDVNIL